VSGSIGEHGTRFMRARASSDLAAEIVSDTKSLWTEVDALPGGRPAARCMRDDTRGRQSSSVLNEIAARLARGDCS